MKKRKSKINTRDTTALRQLVQNLVEIPGRRLTDAICDIIDAGGYSVAVLLDMLPSLPAPLQLQIAKKLEDFFYFHPENGAKLFKRMRRAIEKADHGCQAHLLAAMADIAEKIDDNELEISRMGEQALAVLESDADLARISRAIEVVVKAAVYRAIPSIIKLMIRSISALDKYQNYQFVETALMALKRLGGEPLIRLLVNPTSDSAIRQLRLEWRTMDQELLNDTLTVLQKLDSDFAQVMLKVIDLSDFNLPFIAMVNEGVTHSDKWVRQAAVASMQKASEALSPEILSRMLNDTASEVRLMAATSLGGFAKEQTGAILEELASRQGEALDIRLNALYALYAQKNTTALQNLAAQPDSLKIAVNAQGLAALLMPHDEGLKAILAAYSLARPELLPEAGHYLMELSEPEDIGNLISWHAAGNETQRERIIDFIRQFIEKKAGPRLEVAIKKLSEPEQKAIKLFMPTIN